MNNTSQEKRKKKTRTFIIKNRQGFTQVSNKMLSDQNISYKAKGILCHLLSHDTERFTITSKTLIKHGSDGKKAIQTGIQELKKNNYLKITREAGNKGNWTYILNMFGNKFTDIPKSDISESDVSVLGYTNKNTNIKNTNKGGENESTENGGEEKQPTDSHYKDDVEKTPQPQSELSHEEIKRQLDEEVRLLHEENDRLMAEQRARQQQLQQPPPPPTIVARVEDLLVTSNQFIQSIGFGFTKNPRHILDAIYKQLPPDYQVKEDPKDIELIRSAIQQYDSAPPSEREALAKKFYGTVENMAKLYLIKKHGEEFRDKLPVDLHNRNLVIYIGANPTFKYCHSGWSNEIDAIYGEISRVIRKRQEREKAEYEKDRERVIERERVKEVMLNRPNLSDDQIHAMGLRTVPEIIEAMNKRNSNTNIELLDEKYRPIMQLDEKDKLREEELLRIMISGTKLSMDEQLEFDILRRKKAVGY